MSEEIIRRPGAPKGNQNARKHGFYSAVMDDDGKRYVKQAAKIKGLSQEIDLLRGKLKLVTQKDPGNVKLICQALTTLARLLRTRDKLHDDKDLRLSEKISSVIKDLAIPLGITVVEDPPGSGKSKIIHISENSGSDYPVP